MVKIWIVVCDICGKEINAKKEPFYQTDEQDRCQGCFEEAT